MSQSDRAQKIDRAMKRVLAEISHPGVMVRGLMYMGLPVGYGYLQA